jgi:hypothetical protein
MEAPIHKLPVQSSLLASEMVYSPMTTEHMVVVSTALHPQPETEHHFWPYQ